MIMRTLFKIVGFFDVTFGLLFEYLPMFVIGMGILLGVLFYDLTREPEVVEDE